MTVIPADCCARCKHFKMKEYPDHARVGLGRCMGYDNAQPLTNPFVPWQTRPCVRFFRAPDYLVRQEWIDKQLEKKGRASKPDETISREGAPTRTREA